MAKTIGIDLGTTNSCMAVLEGGEPTVIPNAEGGRTTPSVVGVREGRPAARRRPGAPAAGHEPAEHDLLDQALHGPQVRRGLGGDEDRPVRGREGPERRRARRRPDGKEYAPPEISAMILQKLKADAEAYLGETVTDAVITVPAYFNNAQREATKDAGKIAGLNVVRIINEPTAAALAYGLDKEGADQTILVFDLGGGTFDVSVLELGDGVFEVKSTNGDNHLGGDNFDKAVVDWMVAEFKRDQGIDLGADPMALQRLYEAAREGEDRAVSSTMTTQINLPFITATPEGPKHLDLQLTRAKLEELAHDLLERTVGADEAGARRRRPRRVEDRPRRARRRHDPHAGRAGEGQGADRQGAAQGRQPGRGRRHRRRDPGRRAEGRGQGHPAPRRHAAVARDRDQGRRDDEADRAEHDHPDAQGRRPSRPPRTTSRRSRCTSCRASPRWRPTTRRSASSSSSASRRRRADMPQIEVAFDIDANGIINVSAKDLGTGNEQQIKIEGGSGLKEDEVQRMIKDAEAHADEAHKLRELADARNQAEALAYQTEKSLKEHRDKLDESVASTVEGRIMELRGVLESSDVAEIRAKTDALQEAWTEAASAIYAQASASTSGAGATARVRLGRRGDRGRRLRGGRRGRGQDLVTHEEDVASRARRAARPPAERRRSRVEESTSSPQVTRERDEYLDALQRLKAEFDNYRKRVARDQADLVARASERLVKQLLPVLDDLERALEARPRTRRRSSRRACGSSTARSPTRSRGRASSRSRPTGRSTRTRRRRCSRSRPRPTRAP